MECKFSGEELSAYVDGELDGARRALVEQHLRSCEECHERVEELRGLSGAFSLDALIDPGPRLQAGLARRLAMMDDEPSFTCAQAQIWMSAQADGELAGEDAARLTQHIARCPACEAESVAMQRVVHAVRSLPQVSMPLSLERSIRAEIARRERSLIPAWLTEGLLRPRLSPGFAATMAAAALAIGLWVGQNRSGTAPVAPATVATAPQREFHAEPTPAPTVAQTERVRATSDRPPVSRRAVMAAITVETARPVVQALRALTSSSKALARATTPRRPARSTRPEVVATAPTAGDAATLPAPEPPRTPPVVASAQPAEPGAAAASGGATSSPAEPVALAAKEEIVAAAPAKSRYAEAWAKANIDLDQIAAELNGQRRPRAVVAPILTAKFQ